MAGGNGMAMAGDRRAEAFEAGLRRRRWTFENGHPSLPLETAGTIGARAAGPPAGRRRQPPAAMLAMAAIQTRKAAMIVRATDVGQGGMVMVTSRSCAGT
jgi:hypothetical protein